LVTVEVLVALSGGVDSSVAAALLVEAGHSVVGVTMKLWGGPSDSGCCSVSDVDDARRVAQQLGIDHHVFNFGDDFDRHVVDPYVAGYAAGLTPNPCVECNRHLKFDRLLSRADQLGFDVLATGHHARVVTDGRGRRRIARGADPAKDQSYVLYMLGQAQLRRLELPIGGLTKDEVRARAAALGLRTADKPDSQDVCFIRADRGGRQAFLGQRIPLRPGRIIDGTGRQVGSVPAVELVTLGQRKGLGLGGSDDRRYVTDVDRSGATITVGPFEDLLSDRVELRDTVWASDPADGPVTVQTSAHGRVRAGRIDGSVVHWDRPQPRVAPGQSVVLYDGDEVLGGGIAG
jgi:tRNA-specific 2-thiouridylase